MQTDLIRQIIQRALAHEGATGATANTLMQVMVLRGHMPSPAAVNEAMGFVRDYVSRVPDLLEAYAAASRDAGIEQWASPVLEAAQQYFFAPFDVIFDHLGLVGVLDDAYYAQCLLAALSDAFREATGETPVPVDFAEANAAARALIGEPQASQLDQAVAASLAQTDLRAVFQTLRQPAMPDASTGRARPAAADAGARRTGDVPARGAAKEQAPPAKRPEDEAGIHGGFEMLSRMFDQLRQSGHFTPEREQQLERVMHRIGDIIDEDPQDLAGMMSRQGRMRRLMEEMMTAVQEPTRQGQAPAAGSRAARLRTLLAGVKRYLYTEGMQPKTGQEHIALQDLFARCARAESQLHESTDDPNALSALERESFRKIALDVRRFALRRHLMLARPLWPARPAGQSANAIFFSGSRELSRLVGEACTSRRLELLHAAAGVEYAQARWDDLRTCTVAVFDLTPAPVTERAAVCYELGIALALGRSVVILASDAELPFDVDVVPQHLTGDGTDVAVLADAIESAVYGLQRAGSDDATRATIAFARRLLGGDNPPFEVRHTLGMLDEAVRDPVQVRDLLDQLIGFAGDRGLLPIEPAWPGRYPEPDERRCFHVMPFSLDWSDAAKRIVEKTCEAAGVTYVRGDAVADARVIRSIWDEICRASHVVVDLTAFNANVALELGMAHVLGRSTRIVGQGETVDRLFPALAKVRVARYALDDGGASLRAVLDPFLRASPFSRA